MRVNVLSCIHRYKFSLHCPLSHTPGRTYWTALDGCTKRFRNNTSVFSELFTKFTAGGGYISKVDYLVLVCLSLTCFNIIAVKEKKIMSKGKGMGASKGDGRT